MPSKNFSVHTRSPIKNYNKKISVDSDKSISIRAFLLSSISEGVSKVSNVLESEDVGSTISCLRKLGVKIKKLKKQEYEIFGKGFGSFFCKKGTKLNCGNSGTLARLLIGILSSNPNINVVIEGDHSLNKRNMKQLILLMQEFGATFYPKNKFNFPLKMISSEMPLGINYVSGVSAQLKSAVILAGLNSYGNTNITLDKISRDHTERFLLNNKNVLTVNKNKLKIEGRKNIHKFKINVAGDPSSASFFVALTLLMKNSILKIKNVGLNPTRIGFYNMLKKRGAKIKFFNIRKINNEPVGDIAVKSSKLKPIKASKDFYPSTADEYPILFVLSALTPGVSEFKGLSELKNKESDRILEMKKILKQVGIKMLERKGNVKIYGKSHINKKKFIKVSKTGDHRICMSSMILSLVTGIKTQINDFGTVNTSSPNFLKVIKQIGGKFEIKKNR